MPKASESARRDRRRAEERLATAYGWPDRRSSRRLSPAGLVALVAWTGLVLAIIAGWHP